MIKLKKLLKESKYAWDRKFGDPLPTFKDIAETHQNKPKKELNEYYSGKLSKLKVPSDVSYYSRDWEPVFKEWGNVDFGPRESDMYDWNDRKLYDKVVKEFNAEMGHVAAMLNKNTKNLENAWKTWNRILDKYRKKDSSRDYEK